LDEGRDTIESRHSSRLTAGEDRVGGAPVVISPGCKCTRFVLEFAGPNLIPHTNRLLRQYLPKTGDLNCYDQTVLDAIADRLNNRHCAVLRGAPPG